MSKKLICLVLFAALLLTSAVALATGSKPADSGHYEEPVDNDPPRSSGGSGYTYTAPAAVAAPTVEIETTVTPAATAVINEIAEIEASGADLGEYVGDDAASAIVDAGITAPKVTTVAPVGVINYAVGQGSIAQTFTFTEQYPTGKPVVILIHVVVNGVEKWMPCQAKALNGAVQVVFTEEVLEAMQLSTEEPVLAVVSDAA